MSHIFLKEDVYRAQMTEIRAAVLRFAESKGWQPMSRGRRTHVSIFGKINMLDGTIDIIMEEDDWNTMPEMLQPETSFILYCSGVNIQGELRRYGDTVLIWRAPFSILAETVDRFLPVAWGMLSEMTEANFLKEKPVTHHVPDLPPDFGPPRKFA